MDVKENGAAPILYEGRVNKIIVWIIGPVTRVPLLKLADGVVVEEAVYVFDNNFIIVTSFYSKYAQVCISIENQALFLIWAHRI